MAKKSAIIILSGGLDSTTALYLSVSSSEVVLALTFDYGQRAAQKEILSAKSISNALHIPHQVISLPWLAQITQTSLINTQATIPNPSLDDLNDLKTSFENAQKVWVPNRNGLFLNIGAMFAEAHRIDTLITGFNKEEAQTFPDNSEAFLDVSNEFFSYSTLQKVRVESPTIRMTKSDIAQKAKELNVPVSKLWFCYEGGEKPCHQCESCQRNFRAFAQVGIADPF